MLLTEVAVEVPDLSAALGTPSAVLVPLTAAGERLGLLVLGLSSRATYDTSRAAAVGDLMTIAVERLRAAERLALRQDVTALMDALAGSGVTGLTLVPALEIVCRGLARLLGADAVEVWQHDRRSRELIRLAASVCAAPDTATRVPVEDPTSALAAVLRRDRASVLPTIADAGVASPRLAVPLRGRRRALGVLVLSGARFASGDESAALESAAEIGRQLSATLESVQLFDEVLRSRTELDRIFNSLTDLVIVVDSAFRITDVNRAFETRVARPRQALLDEPLGAVSPTLTTWVAEAAERVARSGRQERAELDVASLAGRFDVTLAPLVGVDPGRGALLIVARDVTTATRLERERADLERRLAHSSKLLALGQFVAGVAHELNNPLQAVLGHLELLRGSARLSRPLARDLSLVYREADRAARIVRNLLLFAGSGKLTRRKVSLNRAATRVLALRARSLRASRIEVVRELDALLPPVWGDGLLLEQALVNLVVNAEQAMPSGGTLTVRTEAVEQGVAVTVRDSGPGITEDVRTRLFEPFFTTRSDSGGSGLGLSIVYGIVRAHDGVLDVESTPGAGAAFRILLAPAPRRRSRS